MGNLQLTAEQVAELKGLMLGLSNDAKQKRVTASDVASAVLEWRRVGASGGIEGSVRFNDEEGLSIWLSTLGIERFGCERSTLVAVDVSPENIVTRWDDAELPQWDRTDFGSLKITVRSFMDDVAGLPLRVNRCVELQASEQV